MHTIGGMNDFLLPLLILAAATLYSSVGHAGASGYLASMALVGVEPSVMKPSALIMNILVAVIGTIRFARAGCFSWKLFLPFAIGSVPMAFVGGWTTLSASLYKQLVGLILLFAAYRMWVFAAPKAGVAERTVPFAVAVTCGCVIGLLSGLTGTGGGIFLSPLLLIMGWADVRTTAGVSVAFILVNSIAGLLGHAPNFSTLPPSLPLWAAAAVVGGLVGSELGSRRLGSAALRRLLAVVLVIAGFKLIAF